MSTHIPVFESLADAHRAGFTWDYRSLTWEGDTPQAIVTRTEERANHGARSLARALQVRPALAFFADAEWANVPARVLAMAVR